MFKNYEDYKAQRTALLDEADALLAEGKVDEATAKTEEVKNHDDSYRTLAEAQANAQALRDSLEAPNVISNNAVNGIIDTFSNSNEDSDKQYRMAFMNYVLTGENIPAELKNASAYTTASDVGAVIPNTILDKIVEKMETVGTILNKVTRTFYKGGVTVPTSSAKPTATWVAERGTVDKQKKAIGSITFAYHKLKVVIAVSMTVDMVSLDVFERTITQNIADAMVKAIEGAIFNGTGATNNQPKGVLTETAPGNVDIAKTGSITFKDLAAAEAALDADYDDAEWYMSKKTYVGEIASMVDSQGQPVARVNMGIGGKPEYSILGRKVNLTSHVADYASTVTADTIFACIFRMEDYLLNTNMDITVTKYEDHDTDDQMTKAVMLVDGKAVDLTSLVTMTKKAAA